MTESEVVQVFKVLAAEYGNKVLVTPDRVRVWQYVLGHATLAEVQAAILTLMSNSGQFPPTVGDVNQAVLTARGGAQNDWGSLWDEVMRAATRSLYYAEEEAKKLNPAALAAIGGIPGLKELAASSPDDVSVIRAQFRQRLEAKSAVVKNNASAENVQALINSVKIKGIENVSKEK